MTEFNNNNKYIPKAPETFQVAYLETNQEVKKSSSSPAARSKVINRSGSNYISENQESYGPASKEKIITFKYYSREKTLECRPGSSLFGFDSQNISRSRRCAADGCFWSGILPEGEYYCISHQLIVGKRATEVAKSFDETARKEGGKIIVSQDISGGEVKTTVEYSSDKK